MAPLKLRGIAFGGDCGLAAVDVSTDGGSNWQPTRLGMDEGRYGFRRWDADIIAGARGQQVLMVRAKNTAGLVQPEKPTWNPGGYMLNVIETTPINVA